MQQENKNIQNLLTQVGIIKQKYDQIAEITGEKFNVFSILGLQDREVRLHSALLNELLNPNGKHGQKELFLKLFIAVVNSKIVNETIIENTKNISSQKIKEFRTETATSAVEIHAGFINKEFSEGGYIDIIINDNNKYGIIIENKIWAGDQEKQLYRYHNYGEKNFENFHLIYLTIDGKEPDEWSVTKELTKNQYLCLSYNEEIVTWLELCRKECSQLPIIRETLTQYINQLKNYSGKSINHMEQEDITKILTNTPTNIELAFKISSSIDDVKTYLVNLLVTRLCEKLENEGFLFEKDIHSNRQAYFCFYKQTWRYCLCYEFTSNKFEYLQFGICLLKNNIPENQDKITNEIIKSYFPNMSDNPYWAAVENFTEWDNIGWTEFLSNNPVDILFKKVLNTTKILENIPDIKL
jgi:hypothetical protein